jgi:dihydrolipoamide dehydrogenase
MANNTNLRVAVIGGGPGGYAAAFLAADLGMKVTMIDPEVNPGGVCLYRGCIPSKALLHVAKLLEEAEQAKNWGIEFGEPKVDLNKLRGWKESVVKKLTGGLGQIAKVRSVQFVQGKAAFVNSTTVKVTKTAGGEENLTFDRIIIATGSRPTVVPSLKLDSPRLMDSSRALDLPDIPKTLLVIGGGYIGLELGSVYATLASAQASRETFLRDSAEHYGEVAQGRKEWHSRNARRTERKRERTGVRPRVDVGRTPSEL